ncbi:MAG: ABC transporter permease subunit [Planctomycetia bacterium]|nr:ABC transporter permease subunit [Planctomycetia bacterium]
MSAGSLISFGTLVLAADEQADINELRKTLILTGVGFLVVLGLLFAFLYATRAGIIARATTKEALRQPVFALLLVLSLLMLVLNTFVPFFSLGDDIKMLEICGLATILISGMLLAIWTSSMSIADEIEGKTAMTLLSKPINRRQFIIGKFVGIQSAVLVLAVPLVITFWSLIVYKSFYDARESSGDTTRQLAQLEAYKILPPVVLSLLEIAIMSAISVAISTRVPMVVNMVTCLAVFVIGHLTPALVRGNLGRLEPVSFMARVIAVVLPAVENFNVEAAIVTGRVVKAEYLGSVAAYSAAYIAAMILLAFILFEDRDLA